MTKVPTRSAAFARGLSIAQLLSAVEQELIPRLLVTHASELAETPEAEPSGPPERGPWASHAEVQRFATASVDGDERRLRTHVSELLAQGVGLDAIYLYLLAPAARELGEGWSRDDLSFVDVQLGLCRLHQLVCECGPVGFRRAPSGEARSILLCAAPGEQHTFGVTVAADFFRRHGWQVSNLCGLAADFIVERLATTHYSAAGFSLHGDGCRDALVEIVAAARARTRNPDLLILVGGDHFARHPDAVAAVGADLSAADALRAVLAAERALGRTVGEAGAARTEAGPG